MNFHSIRHCLMLLSIVVLQACGGGGGSGTPLVSGTGGGGSGGGTTVTAPVASALVLTLSAGTLANNGSQTVTATALALDANNNTVAGVPVTVSADTGVVTPSGKVTGVAGAVTAIVGIGGNATKRTITIKKLPADLVLLFVVSAKATTFDIHGLGHVPFHVEPTVIP